MTDRNETKDGNGGKPKGAEAPDSGKPDEKVVEFYKNDPTAAKKWLDEGYDFIKFGDDNKDDKDGKSDA